MAADIITVTVSGWGDIELAQRFARQLDSDNFRAAGLKVLVTDDGNVVPHKP